MEHKHKYLLKKFLEGNCTEAELVHARVLLQQPDVEKVLDEIIDEETADELKQTPTMDDFMIKRFQQKRKEMQTRIISTKTYTPSSEKKLFVQNNNIFRHVAAWIGFLLLASIAIWQMDKAYNSNHQPALIEKQNKQNIPVSYTLPDSSMVYLAAGSSVKHPRQFKTNERSIYLTGEAFFEVKQNDSIPFIIYTGSIQTRGLGTSFKVSAFENQSVKIAVASGKVSVVMQQKELAILDSGKQIIWNRKTGKASIGLCDVTNLQQWKKGN